MEDFNSKFKLFIDKQKRLNPGHPIFHLEKIEQLANIKFNDEMSHDEIKKSGIKIEGNIIKDSNKGIMINISPLKNQHELILIKQYYNVYKNNHEEMIKAYFLNDFKKELFTEKNKSEENEEQKKKEEQEEEKEDCEIVCIECTIKEEIAKMKEEMKQEMINYLWDNKLWIFAGLLIVKLIL